MKCAMFDFTIHDSNPSAGIYSTDIRPCCRGSGYPSEQRQRNTQSSFYAMMKTNSVPS